MYTLGWHDGTAYVGGLYMPILIGLWLWIGYRMVRSMPNGMFRYLWAGVWFVVLPWKILGGE